MRRLDLIPASGLCTLTHPHATALLAIKWKLYDHKWIIICLIGLSENHYTEIGSLSSAMETVV